MDKPNGQYKEGICPFNDSPELRSLRMSIDTLTATIQGEYHELMRVATGKDYVPLKTHYWTIIAILGGFMGVYAIRALFGA